MDTFHQYVSISEINLPAYVSPSTGIDISSIDHLWHNLYCLRRSLVVSSALFDHYALCVNFRINHDGPPKSKRFRDFNEPNAKLFSSDIENELISCYPPRSNPNEYADYLLDFLKKIMII